MHLNLKAMAPLAVVLTVLALTSTAAAAGMPVGGGETQLSLARGLDRTLGREGVAIKPLGAAKLRGLKLTLPVTSGAFDPDAGSGSLTHSGGFKLVSGAKSVSLRNLTLDASGKKLTATVAGKRIQLAGLGGTKLQLEGFEFRLKAKRLSLTQAAAAVLNRGLGMPNLLRGGRSLGSINGFGEPSSVQIDFGQIALGGPDTAFSKLESLDVQMGIWGATQRWRAPGENYFLFEVAPTMLPPDASSGILDGSEKDGVTMQIFAQPPREMLLRHPRIDLAARELSATLSPLSTEGAVTSTIATLDYSTAKFQIRPRVGAFELMGIRAVTNQFMAEQLNQRFDTPGMFQAGETLARVTINLHAR